MDRTKHQGFRDFRQRGTRPRRNPTSSTVNRRCRRPRHRLRAHRPPVSASRGRPRTRCARIPAPRPRDPRSRPRCAGSAPRATAELGCQRRIGRFCRDLGPGAGVVVDPVRGEGGRHGPGVAQRLDHAGQARARETPTGTARWALRRTGSTPRRHGRAHPRAGPAPRPPVGWRCATEAAEPVFPARGRRPSGSGGIARACRSGRASAGAARRRPTRALHAPRRSLTGRPARGVRYGGSRQNVRQAAPPSAGGRPARNAPGDLIGQVVADRGPERGSSQDVTKVSWGRACADACLRPMSLYSCINKRTTAQDVEFDHRQDFTGGDGPGDRGAACASVHARHGAGGAFACTLVRLARGGSGPGP
jgi:hypothetical protein